MQVSPGTYAQLGQSKLLSILESQLKKEGKRPFVIPVGGSNPLGAFGYIDAFAEIQVQSEELQLSFDHIVFACGSGGTATGLALACRLSGFETKLHAVGVCDSADYFYAHIESTCRAMGLDPDSLGGVRSWCRIYEGQGLGYARSTEEELAFIAQVSRKSKRFAHLVN